MRHARTWHIRGCCTLALAAVSALLAAVALSAAAMPAYAGIVYTEEVPAWLLEARPAPTNLQLGHAGVIALTASNLGDAELFGESTPVTIVDKLPVGLEVTEVKANVVGAPRMGVTPKPPSCSQLGGNSIECTYNGDLTPYQILSVLIRVKVQAVPSTPTNEMTVTGGKTSSNAAVAPASLSTALKVNEAPTTFGVEALASVPQDEKFAEDRQAGSQPFQVINTFDLNQTTGQDPKGQYSEGIVPTSPALQKNVSFKLPPGLVGDVNAVPQCAGVDFGTEEIDDRDACPADTAIGVATVTFNEPNKIGYDVSSIPVFNLVPSPGEPAQFGFEVTGVPIVLNTHIRTGEDYGVTVEVREASETVQILGGNVTLWGVPGDPRHNSARGWECLDGGPDCEPFAGPLKPLLVLPSSCGKEELATTGKEGLTTTVEGEAWNGDKLTGDTEYTSPPLTGCNQLSFTPSISVEPEHHHEASTPTGLNVEVKMPPEGLESEGELAQGDVRAATVELPVGLQTSPGGANGLEACYAEAVGFKAADTDTGAALEQDLERQSFTSAAASCPNAAKIGTVNIKTPILEEELKGSLYLGFQDTNPFASPLAMYLVAEDKAPGEVGTSKVLVKLAGEVRINPSNGQLVSIFKNSPQAPFESLKIHLFGGPGASQATPSFCGSYHAKAYFTPSSEGPVAEAGKEASEGFQITSGPDGGPCPGATLPLAPSMAAGATNTQAGAFSPFSLTINRPDGDQEIKKVTVQLPAGAAAMISKVTPCSEPPPGAAWNCGPESSIGESTASSGLGGEPFTLKGQVYLTQGYDGAPFGVVDATNVEAGPFKLGWVYVRSRINIDPNTAVASVTTDAGPHGDVLLTRLKGVPVELKQLNVNVNRREFELNPTNCNPTAVTGEIEGEEGAKAPVSSPFGVTNCAALPFQPVLTAAVGGQASKADGTSFRVKIVSPGVGQGGIRKVDLIIPKILPARLTTIQQACTEAAFAANPASCPEGSVIGTATIHTPLLKSALSGPVYLVSHAAAAFPNAVVVLQGEGITVIVTGTTYIHDGITYSKFDSTPDAPFTTFETELPAGPHSILTAYVPPRENYNLCKHAPVIPTEITAQDGVVIKQQTKVALLGCKGVASYKTTRAQKLAKAMKACKRYKNKHKRTACESAARKKYGPAKVAKGSSRKPAPAPAASR